MPDTKWTDLFELNELQTNIMRFVGEWVRKEKTPVPHSEIIKAMKVKGIKDFTTINAIQKLLRENYIRRAVITSNKSYYVQLKSVR